MAKWFDWGLVVSLACTLLTRVMGRSSALSLRLAEAARDGSLEVVRDLLDVGTDPDSEDGESRTGLILASGGGHIEVVDELLDRGANPEAKDRDGYTGLMLAASRGHIEVVRKLVKAGVDLEKQGYFLTNNSLDNFFGSNTLLFHKFISCQCKILGLG